MQVKQRMQYKGELMEDRIYSGLRKSFIPMPNIMRNKWKILNKKNHKSIYIEALPVWCFLKFRPNLQKKKKSLSTEGDCTICFPIWCDEWSVILKLFHIRSALLISVCQSENIAPSASLGSAEELLLFLQFMDISPTPPPKLPPYCSTKCITSCPERGNTLRSCRSHEANEVSVPVWTINVTSCSYTVPLSAMEHLLRKWLAFVPIQKTQNN